MNPTHESLGGRRASLLRCHQHRPRRRLANALQQSKVPPAKTNPREALKDILRDYPNMRKGACKKFNAWFKMVNGFVLKG